MSEGMIPYRDEERYRAHLASQAEEEAKIAAQRKSSAATFDKLIESNLALNGSVKNLVTSVYVIAGICALSCTISSYVALSLMKMLR